MRTVKKKKKKRPPDMPQTDVKPRREVQGSGGDGWGSWGVKGREKKKMIMYTEDGGWGVDCVWRGNKNGFKGGFQRTHLVKKKKNGNLIRNRKGNGGVNFVQVCDAGEKVLNIQVRGGAFDTPDHHFKENTPGGGYWVDRGGF